MADDLRKLLTVIVQKRLVPQGSRDIQLEASAVQNVPAEIAAQMKEHSENADKLAPYFVQGLRMSSGGPLVVEDTDPTGNMIAEAFARYMVTTDLATSESVELPSGGYRYTFDVNWPALRELALTAGFDLDSALLD